MIKWYALFSLFLFVVFGLVFGFFLGRWGAIPAAIAVVAVLALLGRSDIRSNDDASMAAVAVGALVGIATTVALIRLAADKARSGVWWPAVLEIAVAVLVVGGGAGLFVRRRRSPAAREARAARAEWAWAERAATDAARRSDRYTDISQLTVRKQLALGSLVGLAIRSAAALPGGPAHGVARADAVAKLGRKLDRHRYLLPLAITRVDADTRTPHDVRALAVALLSEAGAGLDQAASP